MTNYYPNIPTSKFAHVSYQGGCLVPAMKHPD